MSTKAETLYFRDINRYRVLTEPQERELVLRVKQNEEGAINELITANLRFVVSVARRYRGRGLSYLELINEGNVGLLKAAKRFDMNMNVKFISYAVWWIRQSILRALSEHSRVVRLPVNRIGEIQKVSRIALELEQRLEREPQLEEVAEALALPKEQVAEALMISRSSLSFEAPHPQNEDVRLSDIIHDERQDAPDSSLLKHSLKVKITDLLSTLSARQAEVVRLYFGLGEERARTLEEIGGQLNISRERVRQIKEKAISRLRHVSRSRILREYLD